MIITTFVQQHKIIEIGRALQNEPFAELIVDDPNELIFVISKSKYYISSIRWWDRVPIGICSPIGYGGPRDPRDPEKYYFAETDLCQTFSSNTIPQDYINYLNIMRCKYSAYDLYPAFEVNSRDSCKTV